MLTVPGSIDSRDGRGGTAATGSGSSSTRCGTRWRGARAAWIRVEPVTDVLDELTWRGLMALSTDEAALRAHLQPGPVTFYVGFDPTAPSLHFGNLVQLIVARHLQAAGHQPLLLVGGSTGHDRRPQGLRRAVAEQQGDRWPPGWSGSAARSRRFLDFDGPNPARMVNNLDWTGPMSVLDFLRDIGKHFPVNRMLARDVVRNRLDDGHLLHRVLLRAAAVDGLPRAVPHATAARCSSAAATSGATSPPASS